MRVVAGRHRGRKLAAPADDRVRPTSDRVREALFSILDSKKVVNGAKALDLFAGTGALGLEALSRGATHVVFIENRPESRALIRENIEALNETGRTRLFRRDATRLGPMPANAGGPFDLVFVDAPYHSGHSAAAIQSAGTGGWLSPDVLIVVELDTKEAPPSITGLAVIDERVYADTKIVLLKFTR